MSIVRTANAQYTPTCDSCNDTLYSESDFHSAVKIKKLHNWKSIPVLGKWMDFCASCVIEKKHIQKEEF